MLSHSPRATRWQALGSTCLLALPTALSLGGSAQAQAVISSNLTGTLNLATYGAQPVSIASGVSITGTGAAAVSGTTAAQLSNAGTVTDGSGTGIYLGGGGSLSNAGGISGADAVRLNAAGSVSNTGAINAVNYGVLVNNGTGVVSNSGAIAAGYDGVSLNKGGTVTNTGSIFGGHIGVYTGNGLGEVSNSGTISARSGDAVSLYSGGSLTNTASGALIGGYTGVYAGGNGSHITNAGLITGPQFGAYLMGASSISNAGTITGGVDGIMDLGHGGQVSNAGLIHGGQIGVKLAAAGAVDNSGIITGGTTGVKLGVNSTLANEASGHIAGGVTSVVAATGDVLRNAGSITGPTGIIANGAVDLIDTGIITSTVAGGNAISLEGGASTITLGTGAQINGAIAGNGTASQISLTGSGTLSASLIGFAAGSAVTVAPAAVWTGAGQWQVAKLINNGVFTPGEIGTPLSLTGNFVQSAAGTLLVLVSPDGISSFSISGTATLGGTLRYVLAPGTYQPGSSAFLTARGGITGSFAQVTSTGPQAPPVQFTAGSVAAIASAGTSGALTIASPVTVAPDGTPLFADTTQAMAMGAFSSTRALLDHASGDSAASCQAPPAGGVGQAENLAAALAGSICAAGGWMDITGGMASATGGYSLRGGGFLAGVDREDVLGGRIGIAAGYDTVNLSDKSGGTARLQTIRLGLYAAQPMGRFLLSADVMAGIVSRDTTRFTGADAATAKGTGDVLSGDLQLALPLSLGGAQIVPAVGLQIASVSAGPLDETSATQAFALNAAAASGTTIAPYLRMTVEKRFVTASNFVIVPDLGLGVAAMLNNPGASTQLSAQDGTIFTSRAGHLAPVSGEVSAAVSVSRGNWSITARYSGEAGGNWSCQSLQAGVQVRF
jgi:hypothetical protein